MGFKVLGFNRGGFVICGEKLLNPINPNRLRVSVGLTYGFKQ